MLVLIGFSRGRQCHQNIRPHQTETKFQDKILNDEIALAYIIEKNSMRNFLANLISRYMIRVNDLNLLIDSHIK